MNQIKKHLLNGVLWH